MSLDNLTYKDELKVKINYYRKKSGMTQSEVAEKMGMTRSSYAYAETRAERLTPEFLSKLAGVLGVSPNVFISEKEIPSNVSFANQYSAPPDVFITTNKEQRIIKMLRMLPKDISNEFYEAIRNEYEKGMNEED